MIPGPAPRAAPGDRFPRLRGEPEALARALRAHDPPVIARIHDGRVLLDPRTLTDGDLEAVIAAVG